METLADALPKEIERVQEIISIYESVPNGIFAATLMRQDIKAAHAAMMSGDLVVMIAAYKALQSYVL